MTESGVNIGLKITGSKTGYAYFHTDVTDGTPTVVKTLRAPATLGKDYEGKTITHIFIEAEETLLSVEVRDGAEIIDQWGGNSLAKTSTAGSAKVAEWQKIPPLLVTKNMQLYARTVLSTVPT